MSDEKARLLVVGAGVNGSVCAAGLHNAGFDVTLLARGQRLEELRNTGIEIEDPIGNTRTATKVPVICKLENDDLYDYIFVIVRNNQVKDLLPVLAQNGSPSIVFMVNTLLGPEEWVAALGKQRVLLGFAFAGGRREGSLIRAIRPKRAVAPFGEVDGAKTARLKRLIEILRAAGFRATPSAAMPDWLATHAAMVAPLALLILKHGCDTYALARSREDLRTLIDALREAIQVLRAAGRRIVPSRTLALELLPRFAVTALFRKLLSSRLGEIGAGWHCSQAPDEMMQLARELKELVERSKLPAPTLRELLRAV
jgi:2-dehydropantoate 2-reductase